MICQEKVIKFDSNNTDIDSNPILWYIGRVQKISEEFRKVQGEMAIRSNFKVLRAKVEALEGRRIPYDEIAAEANVSEPTLIRFANDKVTAVSYKTIENLCLYFRRKGLSDCDPGDLFVLKSKAAA